MKISYILMSLCLLILSGTALSMEQCHGNPELCTSHKTQGKCHGYQITNAHYHNCLWDEVHEHCKTKTERCKL